MRLFNVHPKRGVVLVDADLAVVGTDGTCVIPLMDPYHPWMNFHRYRHTSGRWTLPLMAPAIHISSLSMDSDPILRPLPPLLLLLSTLLSAPCCQYLAVVEDIPLY